MYFMKNCKVKYVSQFNYEKKERKSILEKLIKKFVE